MKRDEDAWGGGWEALGKLIDGNLEWKVSFACEAKEPGRIWLWMASCWS